MAEPSASDRRRAARRHIPGIEATLRTPGDVKVLDVSLFGAAIEAPAELEVGDSVCLEMRHGQQRANVEAAVRWCSVSRVVRQRGSLVPVSTVGVEFRDIYRSGDTGIWDWIMVPSEPPADRD